MSSLNKVTLIGNLGRDPEIKTFANGGRVANLRIATTEYWKDRQSGERKERTEWHSVVISAEPLVKYVERVMKKGHKVYVEGKLETRNYESKDGGGKKVYVTEVTIRPYGGEIKLLDRPANGSRNGSADESGDSGYRTEESGFDSQPAAGGSGPSDGDLDQDIPF